MVALLILGVAALGGAALFLLVKLLVSTGPGPRPAAGPPLVAGASAETES